MRRMSRPRTEAKWRLDELNPERLVALVDHAFRAFESVSSVAGDGVTFALLALEFKNETDQ